MIPSDHKKELKKIWMLCVGVGIVPFLSLILYQIVGFYDFTFAWVVCTFVLMIALIIPAAISVMYAISKIEDL